MPQLSLHAPFGALTLSEDEGAIVAVDWGWGRAQEEPALLLRAREQVHAYLDGERRGLGGYSEGQDLDTKRYLIQLEARPT